MADELYTVLGVKRDAPRQMIKQRYRYLAAVHHPDKGGDPEKFHKISEAYRILSDERLRARYDQTGTVDQGPDAKSQAMGLLNNLVLQLVNAGCGHDLSHTNIIKLMADALQEHLGKIRAERHKVTEECRRIIVVKKRLTREKKGTPFLEAALEERLGQLVVMLRNMKTGQEVVNLAAKLLAEYKYKADVQVVDMTATTGSHHYFSFSFGG